jgi:uncharacterized protein (DUF2141 family)
MTTLESVPLETVLRDVLDGIQIIDGGLQIEHLTSPQIALVIVRVQRMRHAKVTELEDLTVALGKAKKEATTAHAKAFLEAPGQPSERTQVAKQAAAEAEFQVDVAKAALDACKAAMKVLEDDWDSCRTIAADQRAKKSSFEGIGA